MLTVAAPARLYVTDSNQQTRTHPSPAGRRASARRAAPHPVETLALSVDQTASAAGLSKQTLYSLWAAGKGPAYLIVGVRRLVRREALERWLRGLERQQGEARS